MMRTISLTAIAAIFSFPGVGHAEDETGNFAVKGIGAASCQEFVTSFEQRDQKANHMLVWVAGYLTAVNQLQDQTFDVVSWQSNQLVAASLDAYCQKNTDAPFYAAVNAMVGQLNTSRLQSSSPLVTVKVGIRERKMYRTTLLEMQKRLNEEELSLEESGVFDEKTRQALIKYQAAIGLSANGFPDGATLTALFGTSAE